MDPIEATHTRLEGESPTLIKKSEGIQIKKIADLFFKISSITLATTTVISATVALVCTAKIITTVIALTSLVALSILLAIKAWQIVTLRLPQKLRVPANYIQALATGIFSAFALGCLYPINLARWNPKKEECDPNQPPILMIHGFLGKSNNWVYYRHRLKSEGYKNLFTLNLGSPFKSIDDYCQSVRQTIQEIKERTGRKDVIILSHSMGGLVSCAYNERYAQEDGVQVRDIISLGTPFNGTYMAYATLGLSKSGREMYFQSEHTKKLQSAETDKETRFYNLASKCDLIVQPIESAIKSNVSSDHHKVDWLDATDHVSFLFSDTAANLVIKYLNENLAPESA